MRAVVLRVDSPGGSARPRTRSGARSSSRGARSPWCVSMGDYAASGGFYVSMGADAIVAEPGTITGSIGVFSGKFSLRGLYAKLGHQPGDGAARQERHALLELRALERRGAREGPRAEPGVLRHLREQGGRGAPQGARRDREARAGPRLDRGRGARSRPRRRARRARRGRPRWRAQRARIPAGQDVQLVVLPETQGLLRDAHGAPGAGHLRAARSAASPRRCCASPRCSRAAEPLARACRSTWRSASRPGPCPEDS